LGDVSDSYQIGEVDKCFQPGQLPGEQVLDRLRVCFGLLIDNDQCQRVPRPEMEIHCALGQLRFSENVVEADGVVRALSELVCGGSQDLISSRIRSLIGQVTDR
jgi:hypothetical protein